ncbi:MAG: DUF1874 domain-containing protein [Dehalococcoidia bacterium]|nr:DUF1874 domain-containing protein [Dehalococcoidia bacterium]
MTRYIGNTFSPMMLGSGGSCRVTEVLLAEVTQFNNLVSVVGHEVTAAVLTGLLGRPVAFNRVNLSLGAGDELYCVVPNFRATEAREFSKEEVEAAGVRCFRVLARL